ncbi:hypothetical protein ABFS83_01G094800 [Erythranthe nasuta]
MAYAAVLSLKQTMDLLLSIPKSKELLSHSETTFIYDAMNSFLKTIEDLPSIKIVDAAASERRVIDAVQNLEHLIDSHLSDLYDQTSFTSLLSQQLPKVNPELTSFVTTLLKITDDQRQQIRYSNFSSSSDYTFVGEQQNLLVGLDDQIKSLKERMLHPISLPFVTSVEGMTGIGKTTLVKQVYDDPLVIEKFETRLYVHIGPRYDRSEDIVLLVLNRLGVVPSNNVGMDYLNRQLSEALYSKKYLLVLDNVWAHAGFRLPDNRNGSRVIMISQIQSSYYRPDVMLVPFLKDDDSWKLLYQTAFTSAEECSRELEKIGKKIARSCEGLPAAIIQVGENLRGRSFQEWKTLSEKEDPLVITRDDHTPLSKALYLSYMMLPQNLKICFLYMGVFPKHYGISRSKLTKLWVSEGLLDVRVGDQQANLWLWFSYLLL